MTAVEDQDGDGWCVICGYWAPNDGDLCETCALEEEAETQR